MPADAVTEWLAARQAQAAHRADLLNPAASNAPLAPIESFRWDESFLTGIAEVDKQHRQLVTLINRLGGLLLSGESISPAALNTIFAELVDYTNYHFREEETMMAEMALDRRHIEFHRSEHAHFVAEVVQLRESVVAENQRTLQPVLGFLVHWLAYHILGVDQSMARQVDAIGRGSTAEAAFVGELDHIKGSTEPLVRALHGLLRLVSQRNEELRENNRLLETRVSERTEALGEANRQLGVVAMTDALTGIPNRRHAITMLARAWDESFIDGRPLACLMIDADHLKTINDTHGHDAGDEVIKGVANRLRDASRTDDVVCRLGGDEFLIIAPATPLDGALQLAEKIRGSVAELRISAGAGAWQGSVSIGVAVRGGGMQAPEELIKAADQAVYVAKAAGRNVVATLDGPIPRPD
jgi:hemerythrin